MSDLYTTTDPVTELVALCDRFAARPADATPFYQVIAGSLDISPIGADFFEILGAIHGRLASLTRFVEKVEDQHATLRTRPIAMNALLAVSNAFSAGGLGAPWQQVRQSLLNDTTLANLLTFSAIAYKHRPLRMLSEDDKKRALNEIYDLTMEVDADKHLPSWARPIISDALHRLAFILEHLTYFGHEAALTELALFKVRAETLNLNLAKENGEKSGRGLHALFRAVHVAALIGELLCLPYHLSESWHSYNGWIAAPVHHEISMSNGPKLLPPPAAVSAEFEEDIPI